MQVIWIFVVAVLSTVEAQIIFPNDETEVQYENVFGRCITPNGDRSVCVYLQECGDLYSLITKVPLSNDDKLYLRKSQCGYYNGKVLVCCPSGSKPITTPVTIQPNQGISNEGNVNQGNSNQGNPNQGNPNQGYPNQNNNNGGGGGGTLPQPGVCGSGNSDRIYGGNRTKIDEYPWMVLLEYSKPGGRSGHHCGGVLINERYVLTASHCVNGKAIPTDWRLSAVRLGEWDTATEQDCEGDDCSDPVQNIPIERSIPHEQYNPNSRSQYNDIALLRLSRSIKFTDWIKPICLPSAAYLRSATFEGISLDVAGWGKTETVSASNIKLKAAVDGVSLQQCNQVYNLQNIVLQDTQVCAGGEKGVDSCRGDSGGPLIGFDTSNKVRPYSFLVGVVSFGPSPCGLEGWPGVYTRVGAYLDWIQSHISNPNQGNPNQGNPNQGYPNHTNTNNNGGAGGGTLPQPGVCGSVIFNIIYGGFPETKIDEYPWMVLLEYSKPGGRSGHHCGGVLINERYVLTASHCVNGKAIPTDWRLSAVRLGEWDTATEQDCEGDDCSDPVQNIPIERSIPHEQYNPNSRSQYNDIALLRLSRSIKFTDWIKPICLPSADYLRNSSFEGISLDIAGWGKTETVSASNIKLKAAVDGVSLQQCNQVYNLQNIVLQDTQVCAGGEKGVDSCRGDSGGPLIGFDTSNKVRPYSFLVGVVSFGPSPCGLEGWPGVYTRVGAYLDWIQSHISA